MRYALFILFIINGLGATAQSKKEQCHYIEQMPEPPYDVYKYLAQNLHYPKEARDSAIEGRVAIQFVVTETGTIDSPKVVKSVCPSLDKEALRLIRNMPPWKPGKQNGKPVRVYYTLPVLFRLE